MPHRFVPGPLDMDLGNLDLRRELTLPAVDAIGPKSIVPRRVRLSDDDDSPFVGGRVTCSVGNHGRRDFVPEYSH